MVAAGGIPRLVSLFANSGAEGGAKSARTNAAICLAKLAREPRHKEVGSRRFGTYYCEDKRTRHGDNRGRLPKHLFRPPLSIVTAFPSEAVKGQAGVCARGELAK